MAQRGRPVGNFVRDRYGREVRSRHDGSGLRASGGRHYIWVEPTREQLFRSSDRETAIRQFWEWENARNPERVRLTHVVPEALTEYQLDIDSPVFWAKVEELLKTDPKSFAERVHEPRIAWLDDLRPPEPSPTLDSLLETYLEKKRFRTDHERSVSKLFWNHFTEIVGVRTVRELSKNIVAGYADKIVAQYERTDDEKKSQTWVKHRFGKVKAILRFALKRSDESAMADISRALSYCQLFEVPPAPDPDPRPIDPADFQKLHDAADDLDKALMLFALNCCMYAEEVQYAKAKWLKGDKLSGYRYKRGKIPRIAVLWPRTLEALAKVLEHDRTTVFNITTRQIQRRFKKLRERVGLKHVEFRHLRDGSYTKMEDVSIERAKMVAGHKTGIQDRYVLRRPEKAAEVCAAVERHYFDTEKQRDRPQR